MAGALIVTAELAPTDFAWLDRMRRENYPPDRNRLPAHLTIFHALPPSAEREVRTRLAEAADRPKPRARIEGLMDLGGGVAFRVVSPDLDCVREELACGMHGLLGAQDAAGWRPHITIQNKVPPKVARTLIAKLKQGFGPKPLAIGGLGLHRYLEGPWEQIASHTFGG